MVDNLLLVLYSFGLSFFLGAVFQVEKRYLFWVGVSGAITRVALIFFSAIIPYRFVYTFLPAMCCAIYAQFMARRVKVPYTYFLCPAMLPLIPGDIMTNIMVAFFSTDHNTLGWNLYELILALMGMCLGFVFVTMVMHYRNAYHLKKLKILAREKKKETSTENNKETD